MTNNRINTVKGELDAESIYLTYLSLGDSRTISQLSALTGKTENALYKLQGRYKWKERLEKDSQVLTNNLSISDIGGMESSELLAVTNRATIEKLALFVQHAQPTSLRDAQILSSIYNIIKTEREPQQATGTETDLVSVSWLFDMLEDLLTPEQNKEFHSRLDREIAAAL